MAKKTYFALTFMLGLTIALSLAAWMKLSGQPALNLLAISASALAAPATGIEAKIGPSASGPQSSGGLYSINWETLDGGGGTAAGGDFQLSYTLGQSDAGERTGGNYRLLSGFWPGMIDPGRNYLPLLQR